MPQSPQLAKLSKLSQVFDPLSSVAIAGDGFKPSYVEEAHQEFREQLRASLTLSTRAKLLVAGQPGCGKTTLLAKIAKDLRGGGRVVAFVNLESVTAVQDMGATEMHLAAAAELLEIAEREHLPIAAEVMAAVEAGLLALGARPDAGRPSERIRQLLKIAREDPSLRAELRAIARGGPQHDPQALLSRLLRELEDHQPVVILDGLDKLPPEQARAFFLDDKTKPMADAPCAAVLTIPLSIVYEPTFNVLRERYNNADNPVLPAVRLYEFHGREKTRYAPGYAILQRIVRTRIDPIGAGVMADAAVERAIEASGGNIRELARMIQSSIVKTVVRHGDEVELQDVETAIGDQRESYRRAFQPHFLPVLVSVRDTYKLDNRDDVGKLLLYGLWVVEYRNDEAWYGLPAAVEQLVRRLEKAP